MHNFLIIEHFLLNVGAMDYLNMSVSNIQNMLQKIYTLYMCVCGGGGGMEGSICNDSIPAL